MSVNITEYLKINLETEEWQCRKCDHAIHSARENYKEGLLVYARDPREVHRPIINPNEYDYTFSPDPDWVKILEYYCPSCGTQIEVDYLPPGHPPLHDIELDIDSLKQKYAKESNK